MTITVTLNGKRITDDVAPDLLLYDWLRQKRVPQRQMRL